MNKTLDEFARQQIKNNLKNLPESWQFKFKQMYANGNLSDDINKVVDNMPAEKLNWALSQTENSLKKIKGENND